MNIKKKLQLQKGFTLIELAVVLVVVGILLSSFIGTLTSRIEATRRSETIDELNEIKQAMVAYSFVNGYLPCPDCVVAGAGCIAGTQADGVADYNVGLGRCSENEGAGNVPWVTLGIGRSDAWGTRYRYAVQNEYADKNSPFTLASTTGSAKIEEPDFVADATGATPHDLATSVVAIIFSHGKNGYEGTSDNNEAREPAPAANLDEKNNTNDDQIYYMRPETSTEANIAGGEFDDLLIWISEYELKAKMVKAGKLPL